MAGKKKKKKDSLEVMSKWVGGCTQASAHVPALWKPPPELSAAGTRTWCPAISTEPPTPFTNALTPQGLRAQTGATQHDDSQPSHCPKCCTSIPSPSHRPSPHRCGFGQIAVTLIMSDSSTIFNVNALIALGCQARNSPTGHMVNQ